MEDTTSITVKKPLSWYNRNLKTDFKKLFVALTKSAVMFKIADARSSIKEFVDVFNAVELKTDTSGLAYRLLIKAMVNAAHNLAMESKGLFRSDLQAKEQLYDDDEYVKFLDSLNTILETKELVINKDSFKNPRSISFLSDFADSFKQWLIYFGTGEASAQNITNRLPAYFIMALNDEWRSSPSEYNAILQKIDTPFTAAANRELEWQRYNAFLEKQVNESVFGESFGLSQIYIPLRGYYKQEKTKQTDSNDRLETHTKEFEKIPFYVHDELNKWLRTSECKHCIKFISGGPGSGKSSFAKMWSHEVAAQNPIKVLFIPLHLFDLQSDIQDAVGKYVKINQDINFSFNPLSTQENQEKLLIVFDGLDELSQQGRYAMEVAHNFVNALDSLSKQINRDNSIKTLFLIIGRELAVQANTSQFRLSEHILHFLPYFLRENEQRYFPQSEREILKIDQRNDWWVKYGQLSGTNNSDLPEELKIERLDEITAQPLLNYLVALSLRRGKIKFSTDTNLNDIYKDLIEGVHERAYEGHEYKQIEGLELRDFKRILEEIAVSAWHGGDSRTTSIKRIEEHITRNGLKPLMDRFEKEAEKGILRLLTAFYFREHGISDGEKTFEFTHKSFGEYLTATRLVEQMIRMSDEMELKTKEYDRGWSEEEALKKWMEIASLTAIDGYLYQYLEDEIKEKPIENVKVWQKNLINLLSYMLHKGMPMLEPRKSYKQETALARNASEALLVLHAICANYTKIISKVDSPTPEAFGEWISTLQLQRVVEQNVIGFSCLSFLNLSNSIFDMKDFHNANFSYSILNQSMLRFSCLFFANLSDADLSGAYLLKADLLKANLLKANLSRVDLLRADLSDARLSGANLSGANLSGADLSGANLSRADLSGANLMDIHPMNMDMIGTLMQVATMYDCKNLDKTIEAELKRRKPKLFEKPSQDLGVG
jgi:Pentapeptide repeats (8 copies)